MRKFSSGVEKLAIVVLERAQETGEPISIKLVAQLIDELLGHPVKCRCGRCAAAATVSLKQVLQAAAMSQRPVAATRRWARA
ncbi:MAG: hypothetical protein WBZ37_14125 [Mycobacterium sp.]